MSDDNTIRDTADAIKGIVEAVPVYQDVMQPAAKEVGAALQTVAKTLHVLLAPVSALVWGYDKIKDHVTTKVSEKLKDIPPERMKMPEPSVAGPALEALRYTGYQETLRDLYTNLLATSIDSATAHQAHPAFVEIIKQMSPDEALIIRALSTLPIRPMLDVRLEKSDSNLGRWVIRYFSLVANEAGVKHTDLSANYLINLQRLGLIELRENYTLHSEEGDIYQPLRESTQVQNVVNQYNALDGHKTAFTPGAIITTELGNLFIRACVIDGIHALKV